jgi:type IV secretory pathway TrbF-like protein
VSEDKELTASEGNETEETSISDDYDIETYRHALQEARRSWDQHLDAYNDVAEKSWRIVRLNGIVVTIYIAAVASGLSRFESGIIGTTLFAAGLLSLAISTYLAARNQETEEVLLGQGPDAFERVRKYKPPEVVYLHATLEAHEDGIEQVAETTKENAVPVNRANLLSLIGIGLLTVGTLVAVVL